MHHTIDDIRDNQQFFFVGATKFIIINGLLVPTTEKTNNDAQQAINDLINKIIHAHNSPKHHYFANRAKMV